ncbi:hypothetical protein HQQ94_14970 [Shewanella sp. VB17]|uniref:type III secretion system domain-containing protein n=1 Tax=Shewanella sp. VB17 TaxID=2739432 RepID=UPI001566BEE9|nr:type III secretion system domain-containing protein [Shewanella sp. VB17]NRD74515.1 hypothetical protein [Shewanella sp. VB17]
MIQAVPEADMSVEATSRGLTIETLMNVELKAFNHLVYQPVSSMHPSWWTTLDLGIWQDKYQANTQLGIQIEALVVKRYGLSVRVLPTQLTCQQLTMLDIRFKIEAIVTVLGLFYLNVPEYLSLREYRDALACVLTPVQIQQAWAMWPQRPTLNVEQQTPILAPDKLVEQAMGVGIALVERQWKEDPLWLALALTLTPKRLSPENILAYRVADEVDIPRWLLRLERLL